MGLKHFVPHDTDYNTVGVWMTAVAHFDLHIAFTYLRQRLGNF
jgi:hypothetical protein